MRKRKETLGDVVKQARIKNNVTSEELADKVGVSVRYIYRIESGDKKPSYEVFMELMDVLAIDSELIRMLCNCDDHTQDLVISVVRAIPATLKELQSIDI